MGYGKDPAIDVSCEYGRDLKRIDLLTGEILINVKNKTNQPVVIEITDNAYKTAKQTRTITTGGLKKIGPIIGIPTNKSFGWYDFTIRIKGNSTFERRYAGRVETGAASKTDPFMGRRV
jgi:phospholipase C